MRHHIPGPRHAGGIAILVAVIVLGAAGSASALSSISGHVEVAGSLGTPLPGVRVEVFDAVDLRSSPSVRTVLGSAVTGVNGNYTVSSLPNNTYVVLAFEDLTGQYRDIVYPRSGVPLERSAAYLTPTDAAITGVGYSLYTLQDLAAYRTARVSGTDRYGTSAAISVAYFSSADTVIIASGTGFADALSAAPLAGAYSAPILLTKASSLPDAIGDEIERLGATSAYIIGSTSAVSDNVKSELSARGITSIHRIGGANRYATAEKVIYELPPEYFLGGAIPFVCRGDDFADALSVSPVSAYRGMPILLTTTGHLPAETARAWRYMVDSDADRVIVVGSTAAVSDYVLAQLGEDAPGGGYNRLSGANRYETSAAIAEMFGPWSFIGLASGANFPDALSGGAAVGGWAGGLVLTQPTGLHYAASQTIRANGPYVLGFKAYGGTPALSGAAFGSAINAIGTDFYDIDDPSGLVSLTDTSPLARFLQEAERLEPVGTRSARTEQRESARRELKSMDKQKWPGN